MYKETIVTFLFFFAPFALIELHQKSNSSKLNIEKLNMNEKNNLQLVDHLFGTNKISKSQKRYCLSAEQVINNL